MTIGYNRLGSNGRLGNQMFQYAGLRGISSHLGFDWVIPKPLNYGDSNYGLFDCFKMSSVKENNFGYVESQSIQTGCFHFNEEFYNKCPDNINLHDYFQTEKYFKNIEDDIRKDFIFKNDIKALVEEIGMKEWTGMTLEDYIINHQPIPMYGKHGMYGHYSDEELDLQKYINEFVNVKPMLKHI